MRAATGLRRVITDKGQQHPSPVLITSDYALIAAQMQPSQRFAKVPFTDIEQWVPAGGLRSIQAIDHLFRLFHVGGVKSLREPIIGRHEEVAGCGGIVL